MARSSLRGQPLAPVPSIALAAESQLSAARRQSEPANGTSKRAAWRFQAIGESSCSTAASDCAVSEVSSDIDSDSEVDVDWLLAAVSKADGRSGRVRPASHRSFSNASLPCGAAHRLVRSASNGGSASLSSRSSPRSRSPSRVAASKTMTRSASNPTMRSGRSSRRSSKSAAPQSCASLRGSSDEAASSITGTLDLQTSSSRPASGASAQLKLDVPKSSSRPASGASAQSGKTSKREDFETRQMQALKALIRHLATTNKTLRDLVGVLLHPVATLDGTQAFTQDALDHVCAVVLRDSSAQSSPRSGNHSGRASSMDAAAGASVDPVLVRRVLEVVRLLSAPWIAMKHHMSVPEMSEYQKQRWLPKAMCYLVGHILWRHRAADPLQEKHRSVVESLRWVKSTPDVSEDMMDQCHAIHRVLSEGDQGYMKLAQWRKVIELIATNAVFRPLVRRIDPARLYFWEANGHSGSGLSQKHFMLSLMKTADMMGVRHPAAIFQELASHAETLKPQQDV